MPVFEVNRKTTLDEADFPATAIRLHVSLGADFARGTPPAAERRHALRLLQSMVSTLREEDLQGLREAEVVPVEEPTNGWSQPMGVDLRVVKSAHRLVREVAKKGERGKAVLASELVGESGLSAPTVGRLLKEGEPGYEYLRPYVQVAPSGRTKAIDLTRQGRVLASRIRAGALPV